MRLRFCLSSPQLKVSAPAAIHNETESVCVFVCVCVCVGGWGRTIVLSPLLLALSLLSPLSRPGLPFSVCVAVAMPCPSPRAAAFPKKKGRPSHHVSSRQGAAASHSFSSSLSSPQSLLPSSPSLSLRRPSCLSFCFPPLRSIRLLSGRKEQWLRRQQPKQPQILVSFVPSLLFSPPPPSAAAVAPCARLRRLAHRLVLRAFVLCGRR